MSKKTEPSSPEARLPKGLFDISAGEIRATEDMLATIRRVFESYGFEPLDTPAIEYTDALGKFLPDQDRPNEGVFSFKDDDEQWLSLRYDLTAPLARYVAENFQALPKPFRRYQSGPVWRNEKPGPGRFRQFTQFDADTVGASSVAADAELCMLAADTLEALGVPRGQYVIKVNNRKVLDGVLESMALLATPMRASVFWCFAQSTNWTGLRKRECALSWERDVLTKAVITPRERVWRTRTLRKSWSFSPRRSPSCSATSLTFLLQKGRSEVSSIHLAAATGATKVTLWRATLRQLKISSFISVQTRSRGKDSRDSTNRHTL